MIAMIITFLLCMCGLASTQNGNETFTIDDFLTGRFGQRGFSGEWISGTELQYRDRNGDVAVLDVSNNDSSIVISGSLLAELKADSYQISPDRLFVLISYDTHAQFRHSTSARFLVLSLSSFTYIDVANGTLLQTAHWGPIDHALIYVLDNDIYYSSALEAEFPVRVTSSGVPGVIYNGVPDWVYEEEVLGSGTAYWFSPGGEWLIYLEFNDTNVPEMIYFRYGSPGAIESQYPEEVTIRYPKAGAINPDHKAYLVHLGDPTNNRTLISSKQNDGINYGFVWATEDLFAELSMNRVQNESWFNVTATDGRTVQDFHFQNDNGWITTTSYLFHPTGRYFISIESVPFGSSGHFRHIVLRDREMPNDSRTITSGQFVVLDILGWDEKTGSIYFSATEENKPYTTQVYRVSSEGGAVNCISCSIITPEGNQCSSASGSFSSDYSYVVLTCSAPDPRIVAIYRNENVLRDPVLVLEDNAALRNALKVKALPKQVTMTVEVGGGYQAHVRLQLPPNFNESNKYPLLINVYGGPDYNQVVDGFSVGWDTYLTTNLSVIYGLIDGRGSGRTSDELLFAGYRALGTVEIYDQINVTRILQLDYPWIDARRSAIWGWSYGGYATGRVMELDNNGVFKCGISVAPVTSWLYYDSVYTERYMGLPTNEDNLEGYQNGDLVSHVENVRNKKYYLIHGNADDNVHYQQSMMLSRALELNDVIFQQQSYPEENHSLGGVQRHLYHSMDKFWKECFDL